MLGFELVRADGTTVRLEATDYQVADDGSLVIVAENDLVLRAEAGSWIEVRPVGRKLTPDWPPDSLDLLLDHRSLKLAVGYGHYIHRILPASSYSSGLLNELEALTAAVLARVGLDASHSDHRAEADAVRDLIRRHFHLRPH